MGTDCKSALSGPTTVNNAWINEANNYSSSHPNASYADITAYAGLKLYGDAITITKKDSTSTQPIPLKIDSNGNVVKTPCQQ